MSPKAHHRTIFVEDARVITQQTYPGDQYLLRLHAPNCAAHAQAGNFAHIQCDPALPMRRPFSIMRACPGEGWIDILYKVVGQGTRLLSLRRPHQHISTMGPIGNRFALHRERPRPLLLGGGVGIPPMIFLSEAIRHNEGLKPFLIMGSEVPFPFQTRPSKILVPGLPEGVIAAMGLMEDWDIPSRLTSLQGYPGCYEGYITALARDWLDTLAPAHLEEVEIFACGPQPMLKAVAELAKTLRLPAQVCLEEYMACAVGGCAGCAVAVRTAHGPAMKRVCVDGPVFEANTVL